MKGHADKTAESNIKAWTGLSCVTSQWQVKHRANWRGIFFKVISGILTTDNFKRGQWIEEPRRFLYSIYFMPYASYGHSIIWFAVNFCRPILLLFRCCASWELCSGHDLDLFMLPHVICHSPWKCIGPLKLMLWSQAQFLHLYLKKTRKNKHYTKYWHLSLASHKRDIGKQCRPRSNVAEQFDQGILFAVSSEISTKAW